MPLSKQTWLSAVTKRMGRVCVTATLGLLAIANTGCHLVSSARHAIPAHRLDPNLFDCPRDDLAPLPYAALGQEKPMEHLIGPGDVLGVYVFGVFPPGEDDTPVQNRAQAVNQRYYPPRGTVVGPTTGLPVTVDINGEVDLPLIDRVNVQGLSLTQATDKIRKTYREADMIAAGRERVSVGLITPRVKRVVVLREDTPATPVALASPQAVDEVHRGSGEVIDLPVYESDVLHALAATGGLPGTDAERELYVIRRSPTIDYRFMNIEQLQTMVDTLGPESGVVRIPLVGCPDQPIPFTEQDIKLDEGDVLFVPRRNEYFTTGGMLPGARIPLPRDRDIDVIEAIAMATGSAGGPLGRDGGVLAGAGVSYMREPTRVLILRDLPDNRQITIRVDLDRAMKDKKERIRILPDDVVMLYFKPGSATLNSTLNYIPSAVVGLMIRDAD
ncbi:polysaccharide biosynthesis/export family protein [Crateriforma spongiae]|uniref:polysaccharide biosynthesis/export family protein n=1 Tax=Crateriforma spongiae TaxID=2724528 RepID=UPI0014469575|nr:polysaccharide biosynthesis/export family protein [Crateriforma spongiae]